MVCLLKKVTFAFLDCVHNYNNYYYCYCMAINMAPLLNHYHLFTLLLCSLLCWILTSATHPVPTYFSNPLARPRARYSHHFASIKGLPRGLTYSIPPPSPSQANTSVLNVLDYGAIGDGKTDNVKAFQKALTDAGTDDGGTVYVPPGQYAFLTNSTLNVPKGVTLMGSYGNVPSHSHEPVEVGSILLAQGGAGREDGCFIQLNEDSTLSGFTIFYPNQKKDQAPVPYPWSVCLGGNNPAVTDVECLNCWNAFQAVGAARHYLARIQGQPINIGVYVDKTYDIGRIEDVHFNPWYSANKAFMEWQLLHGRSFVFARTDWEYVLNTFSFGYAIGYHFIQSPDGSCNGNFLGIGADMAANASVQVDSADKWGILITNGEFTAFVDPNFGPKVADSAQVVVTDKNSGNVQFTNTAFWGPSNNVAKVSGSGTTSFSQCIFSTWDHDNKGNSAIVVKEGSTGNLIVQASDFQWNGSQIELGSGTLSKAVITGNVIKGSTRITGKAKNTQIGLNADDSPHYVNMN